MKVEFQEKEQPAENTYTFWFSKPDHIHHIAGQYTELFLPHKNPDARGERNWFTISSSPTEDKLAITTKIFASSSTFKQNLMQLKPGTVVNMAEPMGDFVLPKDPGLPLVFVAGGIGCTPYRSMIKYLQDTKENRQIQLIYAIKSPEEAAFREIFDKLLDFKILVNDKLSAEKLIGLSSLSPSHQVYLSGPEPLVERLDKELKESGISYQQIRTDFFLNYPEV